MLHTVVTFQDGTMSSVCIPTDVDNYLDGLRDFPEFDFIHTVDVFLNDRHVIFWQPNMFPVACMN